MSLPKLQPIDSNKPKKKKILLLGDDFRLPSGIGTISRQIVLKTVKDFDWVQLGAALKHPEHGQGVDISQQIQQETGVADADVKIIPWTGYGDRNILFSILNQERPDCILHFTDPRYWTWLYALEHEIKTTYGTPIAYYSIWDDLPYPMWNAPFYASCDMIMGISKQSDNIHREVLTQNGFKVYNYDQDGEIPSNNDCIITGYVPHGLDHEIFKPLSKDDERYQKFYADIKTKNQVEFVVFWNNRNIRRKQPNDVVLAFKMFNARLTPEQRSKTLLLMHTNPTDGNGTDLRAVAKTVAPECKIVFSEAKLTPEDLNAMYNVADVVVNIASNEGWGLSSTEAMLSATPIINNVTGGLQDQCGFIDDQGKWIRFNTEFSTNHKGKFKKHGNWAKPVFPTNRSLQGSVPTPYIFDDRCMPEDVAEAMYAWYLTDTEIRTANGSEGRKFCLDNGLTAEAMAAKMAEMLNYLLWRGPVHRPRYTFNEVTEKQYENLGIVL